MSTKISRSQWEAQAKALTIRSQAFINGAYVDAASGKTFSCISPIDGACIAQVAECAEEDVNRAVRAARQAFEAGSWSESSPVHRKKVLQKFALLIEQHAEELALLESIDMGKPVAD
nr:aldehyde dehydrogenase family protein [Arenimonas sp.]